MIYLLHFLLPLLPLGVADPPPATDPVIHFARTFNLMEHIIPPVVPTRGKEIAAFRFMSLSGPLYTTSYTTGPMNQYVWGARSEDPPCPFVRKDQILYSTTPFYRVIWVGNTVSTNDISDDGDCLCKTHIAEIQFYDIWVYFTDGSMRHMRMPRLPGRQLFCPNTLQGHHLSGSSDLGGALETTLAFTFRIADDRMTFLADIEYTIKPYSF